MPEPLGRLLGEADEFVRKGCGLTSINTQFKIDIETCAPCGGAVKVIASIEDQAVIKQILEHLERRAGAATPVFRPFARAPPPMALPGLKEPGYWYSSLLTHGCDTGLTPGAVSLAPARQYGRNCAAENPFNATMAPWSSEIPA